jgi:hypothetical protein
VVSPQKVEVFGEGGAVTKEGVGLERAAEEGEELVADRVQPQQQSRVPLGSHLFRGRHISRQTGADTERAL